MIYTTLTINGVEKSLADWGVAKWRREAYNQASDTFAFDLITPVDGPETFPYGSMITVSRGRIPASGPSTTPSGLPLSGVTAWTGGIKWFVGWRVSNIRTGSPRLEQFSYKFAGPWDFFFERLVFQKLWLTDNTLLSRQIVDWRSQVVLGQSLALVSAGDTVTAELGPQYLSIALELKEIAAYVIAQSSYEQTVNGLGWPAGGQFQFDPITTDGAGFYKLLQAPSANCQIPDYVAGYIGGPDDTTVSTTGIMLRAPLDAVNDLTAAECMKRMLRWVGAIGSPVVWFDYTTTPPTLKISTRDQLPQKTLPLVGLTESIKIQRRDDLVPSAIAFKYRISGSVRGTPYSVIVNDVAASVDGAACEGIGEWNNLTNLAGGALTSDQQSQLPLQARRFAAQVGTFDFQGQNTSGATAALSTATINLADPAGGGAALAFWVNLFPQLAGVSGLGFYSDPSGATSPILTDPSGAPINATTYPALFAGSGPYILLDGNICPWMFVPSTSTPAAAVEATINAWFKYADNVSPPGDTAVNGGTVACHPLTIKVKLCNLPSGTYTSASVVTGLAEPVPYGLPGFIYAIESIPQYEGEFTVIEQEITDVCPLGFNLNVSGGLAEWTAMNACVQSISYDDSGRTELSFGPAQHLGNADLVERLRVNRGPRWLFLIGGDQMNQSQAGAPTGLGKNLPISSPSPGNKVNSDLLIPQSLSDLQTNLSAYATALPGVYFWSKGNQRAGISALDAGPGILLGSGASGATDSQWIKISAAELLSIIAGKPIHCVEIQMCDTSNTPAGEHTFKTFLATDDYYHA